MLYAKAELLEQQTEEAKRRCATCAAVLRLTHSMLDARTGKTVRLYECRCGERIWDD